MIRALTWCVGRIKALDVDRATISAYMVGLAPVAMAILMAIGTRMVVAPTLDMTRVNAVASTAMTTWTAISGMPPSRTIACWAIHAAVLVSSMASPMGIRLATRNTVFQLTEL